MLSTVLAFLVTIGVLVIIHEYGHYRAAVACDVKVLRFSVGFGRVLWRRMHGETEFVVSALPLGGYVKMLDEREGVVPPSELSRAFNRKSLKQRAFIVAAGPAANLVLAVLLYACVNWAGVQELRPWMAQPEAESLADQAGLQARDEILSVAQVGADAADDEGWQAIRSMSDLQWQFTQAALAGRDLRLQVSHNASGAVDPQQRGSRTLTLPLSRIPAAEVDAKLLDRIGLMGPYVEPIIAQTMAGGPAERAGLKAGDRIVQINGQVPTDAAQLRQLIGASHDQGQVKPIQLKVLRAGQSLDITVTPAMKEVDGKQLARIEAGIGSPPAMVEVSYGPLEGLTLALNRTWDVSRMSLEMLGKMVVGQASLKNLSGPLTIADYAGRSAEMGWVHYLGFLALVSVSLGVLNLLPLPVLDGGHLMYYLFEGLTGRPISEVWMERLQRGGVAIMLTMMSLALYNDLARMLGSH
ncbi:RIP metalloprotease RseP [Aquabacterium sp. CECT 9606]|uniref:RIP metalloprotease RseP n=1 Tax=Aquabacterium sp. CECT 9606 TaxID=2845822 RepID=UPI001E5341AD|nr:RIP metalloprotease RseP [Aquabacterium sp. CECT 9606]CAH0353532.1 Regulator of sigma-E protease RseP [Aquabacterium sp. CECT 9606]